MRKLIIGLLFVIVAAVALAPVAGGVLTEREYQSAAQRVGAFSPLPGVRVVLDGSLFERGLLSSKAWTTVQLPGDAGRIVLLHTIHHGPFSYTHPEVGLALGVIESQVDPARLPEGQESPIRIKTTVGLDGDMHIQLEGAPTETEEFTFAGAQADLRLSAETQAFTGSFEIAGFESAEKVEPRLKIDRSLLELDLRGSDVGIPLGTIRYSASGLELTREGRTGRLKDLVLDHKGELDPAGEQITGELRIEFAELDLPDRSCQQGQFQLEARNIDAEAVATVQEQRRAGVSNAQLQRAIQDVLPRLLGAGPELELTRAQFVTEDGPVDLYAKLSGRPEMANLPVSNGLGALALFNLDARADMSPGHFSTVSLAMAQTQSQLIGAEVEQTPETLRVLADTITQTLLSEGYLTASDDSGSVRYRTNLAFRNGTILVNDRPVNPMSLLSPGVAARTAGGGSSE